MAFDNMHTVPVRSTPRRLTRRPRCSSRQLNYVTPLQHLVPTADHTHSSSRQQALQQRSAYRRGGTPSLRGWDAAAASEGEPAPEDDTARIVVAAQSCPDRAGLDRIWRRSDVMAVKINEGFNLFLLALSWSHCVLITSGQGVICL